MSLKTWFLATRPWSFVMTFVAVSLAAVLALRGGVFDLSLYLITLLGLILFHAATNMLNDYYDVKNKVDRSDTPTSRYRPHPLLEGAVGAAEFLAVSGVLYGLTVVIALYLSVLRGPLILLLTAIGLIASIFYTAGPISFKYKALGELVVLIVWGPLIVTGSYFVITGEVSVSSLLASLPIGIMVALVLFANNIRDIEYDSSVKIRTLASILGLKRSLDFYAVLIAAAYALVVTEILLGVLNILSIITFLSLPKGIGLIKLFRKSVPDTADPLTAQLVLFFGLLLILGELLGAFITIGVVQ